MMLLGLTEPTAGTARVLGYDPARQALEVKRRVGYLPDAVGFYGRLSGRENLRYTAALNGLASDASEPLVDDLLGQVGLAEAADRPTGGYSRGMLQRLGIADALVKDPALLILDEPTTSIDPAGVSEMLALVRRLVEERHVGILLSSHLLAQVERLCTRVGIFWRGRLLAEGTVAELAELAGDPALDLDAAYGRIVAQATAEETDGRAA
jgi:ABC-2 type transport system ATP-binding protein